MVVFDHYESMGLMMFAMSTLATIVAFRHRKIRASLRYFFIYPMSSSLQAIFFFSFFLSEQYVSSQTLDMTTLLFLNIEFFCYARFYFLESSNKQNRILIKLLAFIYVFYQLIYMSVSSVNLLYLNLFGWQSLAILFLAVVYIVDIFNSTPKANLINEPSFWMNLAAILISLGLTPIIFSLSFLFDENFEVSETLPYSLTFILYSICFCVIIRGFLCSRNEHKIEKAFSHSKKTPHFESEK